MSDSSNGLVYVDDSQIGVSANADAVYSLTMPQPSHDAYTYLNVTLRDDFNHTYTAVTASGWQLSWLFVGNYVQVVGLSIPWISGDLATATFSVDDLETFTFTAPNVSMIQTNVSYYTVTPYDLPQGDHVLHVNVTTATPDSPWLLDYLIIATNPSSSQVSISPMPLSTSSPPNNGNASAASSTSHASEPTTNVSRSDPSDESSIASFPLAPVVGGAAGGIVLIAALLALLFYLWKRSRRSMPEKDAVGSDRQPRGDEPKLPQVTLPPFDLGHTVPRISRRDESVSSRVSESTPPLASGSMARPPIAGVRPGSPYTGQQGWPQHGSADWTHQQAVYPSASMASPSYSGFAQWQQPGAANAQGAWGQPGYAAIPPPTSSFRPSHSPPDPPIYPHPHLAMSAAASASREYFAVPATTDVDSPVHTASVVYAGYPTNPGHGTPVAGRPHGMLLHTTSTSSLVDRASAASSVPVTSTAAIVAETLGSRTATSFYQVSQTAHTNTGAGSLGFVLGATATPIHPSAQDSPHRMASAADSVSSRGVVPTLGGIVEFDGKESRLISDCEVNRAETGGDAAGAASKDPSEDGQRRATAPPPYAP
ncbi:hypothetical protein ONZ51_g7666 [Trametes cubensis]|uniref:Transmembrane protein n=1 Tax=Trametes cubensis TaxID=1111947 RepID=A0AAD7X774_9APHY|nr:hypothetical protein ONZ51_g7666 [Trametes cubensis]